MNINIQETLQNVAEARIAIKEARASGKTVDKSKDKSLDLMEKMVYNLGGDFRKGRADMSEALMSTDTAKLIPKILEGKMREAQEINYLGTNFFQTIHVEGGSSAVFVIPIVGELYAHEVGEAGNYREQNIDMTTAENSTLEVRVKKIGCKVSITEEAVSDSSWDILGINVRKMGGAMSRYKEEEIFNNFSTHGHVTFNNYLRKQNPEFGTTGRNEKGDFNDTFSCEDFLDMSLTLMGQGFSPTDLILHPLTWVVFARNGMLGNGMTYGAFNGSQVHPQGGIQGNPDAHGIQNSNAGQKYIMTPEQTQNRLPMPMTVNFSPFVKFDKESRRFDCYIVDRKEVGIIVEKEKLTTDQWTEPERDIRSIKCKERYGISVLNNGRAITVCKGIAVAPTYPVAPVVTVRTTDSIKDAQQIPTV